MLFEELGKIKRTSIMTSIVLAAIGFVMIMCPSRYVNALVSVLGYTGITFAAVLILEFISGKKALINYIILTGALILMLLGIAVLVFSDHMVQILGIAFGVILLGTGIAGLANAWMYARRAGRKGWQILALLSFLLAACGLLLLINPWWNEPAALFDVIGCMLLFSSLVNIARLMIIWPVKNHKEG